MSYNVLIDDKVYKDLKKIDKLWQKKILQTIKEKIAKNPYSGKKLVGDLSPYYRYRINDYRIIYEINENLITVIIIKVKHRKDVYR